MLWWIILPLMLSSLLQPYPVHAQTNLTAVEIDRLQIDIMPEYDRPDVLVIYHIVLSSQTPPLAKITWRIPVKAGKPNAVAYKDFNGGLINLDYTTSLQNSNWIQISFIAESEELQLEYYDPGIQRNNLHRQYDYQWIPDYPVNALNLTVLQPVNSTQFQLVPDMGSGRKGDDGLTRYMLVLSNVEAGSPVSIKINYEKPDDTLTANFNPVQPSQPIPSQTIGIAELQRFLPWIWVALGMLLIAGGALFYIRSEHKNIPLLSRHRHASTNPPQAGKPSGAREGVYCHQCGRRASSGDIFCRTCGTKLRIE